MEISFINLCLQTPFEKQRECVSSITTSTWIPNPFSDYKTKLYVDIRLYYFFYDSSVNDTHTVTESVKECAWNNQSRIEPLPRLSIRSTVTLYPATMNINLTSKPKDILLESFYLLPTPLLVWYKQLRTGDDRYYYAIE